MFAGSVHRGTRPRQNANSTLYCDVYTYFNLALTLFMALVFTTNNHYFSVSLDYFAFIAHRLYRRSDFHKKYPHKKFRLFKRLQFFRDLRGVASLFAIIKANAYIIAKIHSTEAQVCANWVCLSKSAVLDGNISYQNKKRPKLFGHLKKRFYIPPKQTDICCNL